jgi:hypothetical protein
MDAIKTSLERDIAIYSALIDAWKKVSFPTKKDGSAFKVMSKNISGARYDVKPYLLARGQYELTVTAFSNPGGYNTDSINCYELVKYLKDESMKAKTENYQPKEMYLEQVYTFDIEDIKNAVSNRIEYLENYVSDLKKQLASLETVFRNFRNAFDNAIKTLEHDTKDFSHKDMFYAVRDCVIHRYPYC